MIARMRHILSPVTGVTSGRAGPVQTAGIMLIASLLLEGFTGLAVIAACALVAAAFASPSASDTPEREWTLRRRAR